jgi:hypothetical protein
LTIGVRPGKLLAEPNEFGIARSRWQSQRLPPDQRLVEAATSMNGDLSRAENIRSTS